MTPVRFFDEVNEHFDRAAALLDYPRYFDVRTGLACPAEVILDRLAERGGSVTRQATLRHKWVAAAQYRLRRFAPVWRRRG